MSITGGSSSCPWKKSSMSFFHLENLRFSRVLRTRDRLVRSGRRFIHSLLAVAWKNARSKVGLHDLAPGGGRAARRRPGY